MTLSSFEVYKQIILWDVPQFEFWFSVFSYCQTICFWQMPQSDLSVLHQRRMKSEAITGNVNLNHLIKAVAAKFPYYELTLFPLYN